MLSAVAVSEHVDETAILGQDLTYTVVVSNLGTVTATGVTVTDVLPLSLEPASATSTGICVTDDLPDDVSLISAIPTQGICSSYPDVVCELEQLSPADSAEVSVKASIAVSMRGQLLNTVVASSTAPDNILGNNVATAVTQIPSIGGWSMAALLSALTLWKITTRRGAPS